LPPGQSSSLDLDETVNGMKAKDYAKQLGTQKIKRRHYSGYRPPVSSFVLNMAKNFQTYRLTSKPLNRRFLHKISIIRLSLLPVLVSLRMTQKALIILSAPIKSVPVQTKKIMRHLLLVPNLL
jgi:hypothetical protein